MPNVIEFAPRLLRLRMHSRSGPRSGLATAVVSPEKLERALELREKAKSELKWAILLLDIALWRGREIANKIVNPGSRAAMDEELNSIEDMLQIAREKAQRL